jgi:signal transduction histidine kinase
MSVLASELDRMVVRVAESRMQLVDQSFQAGFAELAKGVLHNLGNAMTPIGVRLANLAERLRRAPAGDAELAVAELQAGAADAARAGDLEEFLRLAAKELAATVRVAQEDVAVMTRQTTLVQATLAEQMRSTRNDHVIEPVRLTELVSQSLEIVPDACRQRLRIDTDETLKRLGAVRVARTVLRLILQNLIINAADAVRDAGKERGVLPLSAEIVREDDMQQLHRGAGTMASASPRSTSHASSKRFLHQVPGNQPRHRPALVRQRDQRARGRIWAASEGPGHGASMHLMVPLGAREPASLTGAA